MEHAPGESTAYVIGMVLVECIEERDVAWESAPTHATRMIRRKSAQRFLDWAFGHDFAGTGSERAPQAAELSNIRVSVGFESAFTSSS